MNCITQIVFLLYLMYPVLRCNIPLWVHVPLFQNHWPRMYHIPCWNYIFIKLFMPCCILISGRLVMRSWIISKGYQWLPFRICLTVIYSICYQMNRSVLCPCCAIIGCICGLLKPPHIAHLLLSEEWAYINARSQIKFDFLTLTRLSSSVQYTAYIQNVSAFGIVVVKMIYHLYTEWYSQYRKGAQDICT